MMISGANNLYNKRQTVDDLNVFPVPDGDTGTNMSMTVCAMAKAVAEMVSPSVSKVADTLSYATLRGARGNSGVILSQFFRGIAKSVKGKTEIDAKEFADALKQGSDAAYKAVMNPTEGTILTVAREIAQHAVSKSEEEEDIKIVLEKALKHGNKVLAKTPEMLPALKKAGVVDAGGQGWLFFLEGALYYLQNEKEVEKEQQESEQVAKSEAQTAVDVANIRYMYCTEFIIEKKNPGVNVLAFREAISEKGDSMLVIDDDDIVKVHIHTNHPGFVLEKAVGLGAMINIKIDNMKHQHKSLIEQEEPKPEPKEKQEIAFVAVCAGDGISGILKELGVSRIIEGGQTMNPSTEDILKAVAEVHAKTVFVFPNNKNIILAANQAKELCEDEIIVVPTRSVPECVTSMLAYKGQKNPQDNEKAMLRAIEGMTVGQITYAVRDTEVDGTVITEGDILGICKGKITETGKEPEAVLKALVDGMCDEDSEFLTIYYGQDVTKETAESLAEDLEEIYPELEISVQYGGQPLYYYILSVE